MVRFHSDIRAFLLRREATSHAVTSRRGPSPNSAVPTRTCVLPSSTATSRSSLIPIEHTRETEPVDQPAHQRESRGAPPPVRPRSARPSSALRRRARRRRGGRPAQRRRRAGSRPCPGSPVVSTCTSTRAPGVAPGDLVDERRRGRPSRTRRRAPASRRTLFVCSWPMKWTSARRRRADAAQLGEQLLGVVLADRPAAGGDRGVDRLRRRSPW